MMLQKKKKIILSSFSLYCPTEIFIAITMHHRIKVLKDGLNEIIIQNTQNGHKTVKMNPFLLYNHKFNQLSKEQSIETDQILIEN